MGLGISITVIIVLLMGAGSTIAAAARTAPGLGRFKRGSLAVALYAGFLFTLPVSALLLGLVSMPLHGHAESIDVGGGSLRFLLVSGILVVVAAPGLVLLHFAAGKAYGVLGARVSEEARRAYDDTGRARTARDNERIERAARAEAAERTAKNRIDRRF